ncbi:MAG: hypothetical protein IJV71_03710 [Lachnospiraceae bacterium]|nr:hypothetical protein [Lachnospiraceae bacterium]
MYTPDWVIRKLNIVSTIQIIFGTLNVGFWGIALAGAIQGDIDLREHLVMYLICTLGFAYMVYCGVRNIRVKGHALRYNSIFMADMDGYLSIDELSTKIGLKKDRVAKEIDSLIRKGYITNCSLHYGDTVHIVLTGQQQNLSQGLESIYCPKCGANILARRGFISKCKYCGVEIKL